MKRKGPVRFTRKILNAPLLPPFSRTPHLAISRTSRRPSSSRLFLSYPQNSFVLLSAPSTPPFRTEYVTRARLPIPNAALKSKGAVGIDHDGDTLRGSLWHPPRFPIARAIASICLDVHFFPRTRRSGADPCVSARLMGACDATDKFLNTLITGRARGTD